MAARRHAVLGALFVVLIAALLTARGAFERIASAQRAAGVQAPTFEVDPLWPRPLPNHWVLGQTIGVGFEADVHSPSGAPKEAYVRVRKAESAGVGGEKLWRPVSLGLRPQQPSEAMVAFLGGQFI